MFDPVFEVGFLLFVWAVIGVPAYWITKKWMPLCSPVIMAIFVPIAGMVGFFGVNATGLIPDGTAFAARMAADAIAALLSIAFAGSVVSLYRPNLPPQP